VNQEIIVEIGNIHEGSVGIAKSLIDMVASSGADSVKFQMHISEYESHETEDFRIKFSDQDKSRNSYWDRVSFSSDNWRLLDSYATSKGLEFLCTPFSIQAAVLLLEKTKIRRWKVGSGDASNFPLIDFLIETNLPMIISTGLVSEIEINRLLRRIDGKGARERTTLMHCVSQYPTPVEKSGLDIISYLKNTGYRVGLSDHSGNLNIAMYALSLEIEILEIHLTPHKLFFGPDVTSSLVIEEIESLVKFRNTLRIIRNSKSITRNDLYHESKSYRELFRKGIYFAKNLPRNHVIRYEDLLFLKPSRFIDAIDFESVLGKTLMLDVQERMPVEWGQLNG
jgi:N,N'-diacetyllegionaminate synthase